VADLGRPIPDSRFRKTGASRDVPQRFPDQSNETIRRSANMKSIMGMRTLSTLLTVCIAGLMVPTARAEDAVKRLEVKRETPKLEVRESQLGFRDTLLFYTFAPQQTVLKLQIGNQNKSFPVTGTLYFFAADVTPEGIAKWLNNQHSDALFADAATPVSSHKLPAKVCKVLFHKFIDHSQQPFGEFDNYAVTFQVDDYAELKGVTLKKFAGTATVHIKTN
jgi:hypothetical protein